MATEGSDLVAAQRPLWAPWRIEYIRGPKDKECFFCVKGARDCLQDHIIHKGRAAFVLLNDYPYNSGHLLVAPYRHLSSMGELNGEERQEMMELLIQAQAVLTTLMKPQAFNVGFNVGEAAGAGVKDHIHGHVVPRWQGDTNFMPVLGGPRVVPESLDATAELLRQAWA
jgi:ATP adenylyltransferase